MRRIPRRKGRFPPLKPSSRKKIKETMTMFETNLTSDNFYFIIASLNEASMEIEEKKEDKKEEVFNRIKDDLQGVQ
jgi:hypothetical protein